MVAKNIRFNDDLDAKGKAYAVGVGISFNALVVIALTEYLKANQVVSVPQVATLTEFEAFQLTPPPPDLMPTNGNQGRQERREEQRLAKKATKPRRY